MSGGEQPLLSERPSSELSHDQGLAEEDALLTGQHTDRPPARGWRFWREAGLFAWAAIATAVVIILAVVYQRQRELHHGSPHPSGKRNLIFMVSDGMGPTSLSLTRSFRQFQNGLPPTDQLVLDQYLVGQSRTRSTSSLITDSAAGATAFSCAQKSYNGAISVLPSHEPCGTVLEAAKKAGYLTGLVVTTRLTDATPACFAAHVNSRNEEDRIAEQMVGNHPLGRVVDLMLGGGKCHFLPNTSAHSCRDDEKDAVALARENGFHYVSGRQGFNDLQSGRAVKLPLLGLFADTDVPFEIDRMHEEDIYPSLDEMAQTALTALSEATKNTKKGFFLMIEGSRIDHAGHANDPAAQVHEVLAYDKAFARVVKFLDQEGTDGVMVSTSDHETGGLATARQLHESYPEYSWYPSPLANASASAERLASMYYEFLSHSPSTADIEAYLSSLVSSSLGIRDATLDEMERLVDDPASAQYQFADMISRRSQTGWTTHGHSAADVNIYASDASRARPLVGNHENTEVGAFLREYLDVDVDAVTRELRDKAAMDAAWMGKLPADGERLDGQTHVAAYSGDFKKRGVQHQHARGCGCGA